MFNITFANINELPPTLESTSDFASSASERLWEPSNLSLLSLLSLLQWALRAHTVTSAPTFHSRQFQRPIFPPKNLRFRNSSSTRANSVVEALIGIQGHGRSASPQQAKYNDRNDEVEKAVKVLEALPGVPEPTSSSLIEGRWQLMFTTRPGTASPIQRTFVGVDFFSVFQEVYLQAKDQCSNSSHNMKRSKVALEETDSWLENAANGLMGTQIIKGNEQIKFVVDALLGLKFSISGTLVKTGSRTYDVTMDDAAIIGGGFEYPLEELGSKFELELLYSDDKIRISRGYNKLLFLHVRTDGLKK
ncbi:probable plastid-lipid-associated protein 12, chloroplastic [Argentina anserina]|uniref:probable plastid-lipid-associated protein 12, chloroplastic n=1 Tax=Argentina anserina TaxID=57926 RepID=UPI0021766112|nr:probable plastid-lipid-associated protein 12, chloroplastic [Potentilla anserina]